MLLKTLEYNEYKVVLGFYHNTVTSIVYITYDFDRKMVEFIHDNEVVIVDNTYSSLWRDEDNNYLPSEWHREGYLYQLSDDLSPLDDIQFSVVKEYIVDKEFNYYEINKEELPQYSAIAIGDKWVLCPECDHAFEIVDNPEIVTCSNIACNIKLQNPYHDYMLDRKSIPITIKI